MENFDGLLCSQAGSDELPAAGIAEHQVRLYKPEGNVQVCENKAFIDIDGGAGLSAAEVAMLQEFTREVVFHAVARGDVRTDDLVDLFGSGWAMETGGDEDGNALGRDVGLVEAGQERRKSPGIGSGPSDIADRNGGSREATG
jgi:hypothetical protein